VEQIFNWPGIGRLMVMAVFARDFPMVQTCLLLGAGIFIVINFVVDILYSYIDPRIRRQ
jgi:peptide/nickel transport system permease protein